MHPAPFPGGVNPYWHQVARRIFVCLISVSWHGKSIVSFRAMLSEYSPKAECLQWVPGARRDVYWPFAGWCPNSACARRDGRVTCSKRAGSAPTHSLGLLLFDLALAGAQCRSTFSAGQGLPRSLADGSVLFVILLCSQARIVLGAENAPLLQIHGLKISPGRWSMTLDRQIPGLTGA